MEMICKRFVFELLDNTLKERLLHENEVNLTNKGSRNCTKTRIFKETEMKVMSSITSINAMLKVTDYNTI